MKIQIRLDNKSVPGELTMTRRTTGTEIDAETPGEPTETAGDGMTGTRLKRGQPPINYLFLAVWIDTNRID